MNRKPEKWNDIGKYLPTREDLEVRRLLPIAIEDIQEQARELAALRETLDQALKDCVDLKHNKDTLAEFLKARHADIADLRQERDRLRELVSDGVRLFGTGSLCHPGRPAIDIRVYKENHEEWVSRAYAAIATKEDT